MTTNNPLAPSNIQELEVLLEDKQLNITTIVFSEELSPKQALALEEELNLEAGNVIDKFELILEIFEAHSTTQESKLRCNLARIRRELPLQRIRLLHKMGSERKASAGIGGRGIGVSRLDLFTTSNRKQESKIERKLEIIRSRRELQRKNRTRGNFLSISILGYTCAGKSTLVNAMSDSSKHIPTDSNMFTTISPHTRRGTLRNVGLNCLITDTVGFIEELPELLRESFLSTFEEGLASDLLLICVDGSESKEWIIRKLNSVLASIDEIGSENEICRLIVLTKKDQGLMISPQEIKSLTNIPVVSVSAIKKNINELNIVIANLVKPTHWELEVETNSMTPALRSFLFREYNVISESFGTQYSVIFSSWRNIISLRKKISELGLIPKIKPLQETQREISKVSS